MSRGASLRGLTGEDGGGRNTSARSLRSSIPTGRNATGPGPWLALARHRRGLISCAMSAGDGQRWREAPPALIFGVYASCCWLVGAERRPPPGHSAGAVQLAARINVTVACCETK